MNQVEVDMKALVSRKEYDTSMKIDDEITVQQASCVRKRARPLVINAE